MNVLLLEQEKESYQSLASELSEPCPTSFLKDFAQRAFTRA